MSSFNANIFIHAANILLLVAYCVRDILWLRLFAVAASLIAIPFYVLQPSPLWAPLAWSVLFAGINLFQSWRLLLERRPVKLTSDEEEARRLAFEDLPPRKVLHILGIGSWVTKEPGARLIERGKPLDTVTLLIRGKVRVTKGDRVLGDIGSGGLVGSALLLSGAPADVDAVATESVRGVSWEAETLDRYLGSNPEARIVLQRHLSRDLAGKLEELVRGPAAGRA